MHRSREMTLAVGLLFGLVLGLGLGVWVTIAIFYVPR